MTGTITKNKIFFIILSLLIIIGILIICVGSQRKKGIPSKGVFVIKKLSKLEKS